MKKPVVSIVHINKSINVADVLKNVEDIEYHLELLSKDGIKIQTSFCHGDVIYIIGYQEE